MKLIILTICAIFLVGCASSPPQNLETSCQQDSDCACGVHITTGQCFYGNVNYVNISDQCPDFCTGIDGKFQTKCVAGICSQVRNP